MPSPRLQSSMENLTETDSMVLTFKDGNVAFSPNDSVNEKRVTVGKLDGSSLKFPVPEDGDITRAFVKIDDEKYSSLVKASERRP